MIFSHILEWNTLAIQKAIVDKLKKLKWEIDEENITMGFSNEGKSAFIIEAKKKKFVIQIHLENEDKRINIKAGIHGKYLPEGKKLAKYSKVFSHTQLAKASKYFEEILEDLI